MRVLSFEILYNVVIVNNPTLLIQMLRIALYLNPILQNRCSIFSALMIVAMPPTNRKSSMSFNGDFHDGYPNVLSRFYIQDQELQSELPELLRLLTPRVASKFSRGDEIVAVDGDTLPLQ